MRKILEQENICASLKGRIQYLATRYRKAHDQEGRVAIRLDGVEIFQSCFFDWQEKRDEVVERKVISREQATSYWDYWDKIHLETKNHGGFDQYGFYEAFHAYHNQSIETSFVSPDPVVRLFATLDKRVGKRRLEKLLPEIEKQPAWLQVFFKLRLEAEGLVISALRKGAHMHMKALTLAQAADAMGGKLIGGGESTLIRQVVMDSRLDVTGALFVAIEGARADGHDFVQDVLARGAVCCLVEREIDALGGPCILVDSTLRAVRDLAAYYRGLFDIPIIGITGSVGKTSTKEMMATVLSETFLVHKTVGNLNNELGVPMTLLALREEHEAGVI